MANESGVFEIKPMDQFIITPLFSEGDLQWYTFTNQSLWMLIALIGIILLFVFGIRKGDVVPGRIQSIAEVIYVFVHKMVLDITGEEGLKYFPYIFTLFLLILFGNVLGLLPYSFTFTSHIAVTGILALLVFISVTILGFVKNGLKFLGLFWISSAPLALRPVLLIIEVISYFVRPFNRNWKFFQDNFEQRTEFISSIIPSRNAYIMYINQVLAIRNKAAHSNTDAVVEDSVYRQTLDTINLFTEIFEDR